RVLSCDESAALSGRGFGLVARGELLGIVADPLQSGDSFRSESAFEFTVSGSANALVIVVDGLS
ncbi:MAG: hypothetical protein JO246_06175, partial [Frankiaceae bacterium]|nr:hypothetical protein [Frankiaceae bacterium]